MLDLRIFDGLDDRLSGPAFVLSDDGAGLGDREWMSLTNLHDSKKKFSPKEIGQYGMGTRSYFHYADVILVSSNGIYKGIDPRKLVTSHGRRRAGWKFSLQGKDMTPSDKAIAMEADKLFFENFPPDLHSNRGATFRLPLRLTADDSEDQLGGPISVHDADCALEKWTASLSDHKVLLFLANVETVSLWRWAEGAPAPTLMQRLNKTYLQGSPFHRLPQALPPEAGETFSALSTYVTSVSDDEGALRLLSSRETALVTTTCVCDGAVNVGDQDGSVSRTWLVTQRFDVESSVVRELLSEGCLSVPIVSVALPLDNSPIIGAPFCSLPVGSMTTGLSVHVNASFAVHKNRRSLWYEAVQFSAGDQHNMWSLWNRSILNTLLPRLFVDALLEAIRSFDEGVTSERCVSEVVFSALPDLENVQSPWREFAVEIYRLAGSHCILPSIVRSTTTWVSPDNACVLDLPTPAFLSLRSELYDLYRQIEIEKCSKFGDIIVQLPLHVEMACVEHTGMADVGVSTFLKILIVAMSETEGNDMARLCPIIVALAEYADRHRSQAQEWCEVLAKLRWVPLVGCATLVTPAEAFLPGQSYLQAFGFAVVERNTADFRYPKCVEFDNNAVMRTMKVWGLKSELSWADVVLEARRIAEQRDVKGANFLLDYLDRLTTLTRPNRDELKELKCIAFIPGVGPAVRFPPSSQPEQGDVGLFPPQHLRKLADHSVVWAVLPTALRSLFWIDLPILRFEDVIKQIWTLSDVCRASPATVHVVQHMLTCAKSLKSLKSLKVPELQTLAWVPSALNGSIQLVQPHRVAHKAAAIDLSPLFGQLPEIWLHSLSSADLRELGVQERISDDVLMHELRSLRPGTGEIGTVSAVTIEQAIPLVLELGSRCKDKAELRSKVRECCIPTKSNKLVAVCNVFIDDACPTEPVELLHGDISANIGRHLGCTSVRDELARRCEVDESSQFGPVENIADRIAGILRDYNDPVDVLREHWQNCDDAGAEMIFFCFDSCQYAMENLVDDRATSLQGPALILASSRPLMTEDILAMQRLGASGKCAHFGSVGRFGVGLNCMYHIADAFTFLAHDALHIFDPMKIAVARGANTGKKYNSSELASRFPNMLEPFARYRNWPTVFRLPLRKEKSKFGGVESQLHLQKLLKIFSEEAGESLLFSKHVKCAKFMLCNHLDEPLQPLAQISRTGDDTFNRALPSTEYEVNMLLSVPRVSVAHIEIDITREDSTPVVSHWIVSHALSFHGDAHRRHCISRYHNGIALLPHGATALLLDAPRIYRGRVCNYFPLRGFECGPPLLLHAHWDVHSSRKSVPIPERAETAKNDMEKWNIALIFGPVAHSLANLLLECTILFNLQRPCVNKRLSIADYIDLLELKTSDNSVSLPLRKHLSVATITRVLERKLEVFPVTVRDDSTSEKIVLHWRAGGEILLRDVALCHKTQDALVHNGLFLVDLPALLFPDDISPKQLSAESLCRFLASKSPHDLFANLSAKNKSEVVDSLLTFAVKDQADFSVLSGVPLLRVKSGVLEKFGKAVIFLDHFIMLPHLPHRFIEDSQKMILFNTNHSRDRVESLCECVGLRKLEVNDLLEHRQVLHDSILLARPHTSDWKEWCDLFWQLMWMESNKKGGCGNEKLLDQYDDWRVVRVHTATGETLVALRDSACTLKLNSIDMSWMKNVSDIVHSLGFYILSDGMSNDSNLTNLLLSRVRGGDDGLLELLLSCMATPNGLSKLNATFRMRILEYFSVRSKLSGRVLNMLKQLPLFLLATQTGGTGDHFTSICNGNTYVTLVQGAGWQNHVGNLTYLPIPKIVHLAHPGARLLPIFHELGILNMCASDFVTKYLCPYLPIAAGKDFDSVLRPLLDELRSWMNPEMHSVMSRITDAAKTIPFVLTAASTVIAPYEVISPELPVVRAFRSDLCSWLPHETLMPYISLLDALGMQQTLSAPRILHCARALDKEADEVGGASATTKNRSFWLVSELFEALSRMYYCQINSKPWSESVTCGMASLLSAARLRIMLAYCAQGSDDIIGFVRGLNEASHVQSSPFPLPPWPVLLVKLDCNVALDCKDLVWSQRSLYAKDEGRPQVIDDRVTKASKAVTTILTYRKKLNTDFKCICGSVDVSVATLVAHLRVLVQHTPRATTRYCSWLRFNIFALYEALGKAIERAPHSSLSELSAVRCLPIHIAKDAGGVFENGGILSLHEPRYMFFRLLDSAYENQEYLKVVDEELLTCIGKKLLEAMGVRKEPGLEDWVGVLQKLSIEFPGECLLPNQLKQAELATGQIISFLGKLRKDAPRLTLDLFLLHENKLLSVTELVWDDAPKFSARCTQLADVLGMHCIKLPIHWGELLCHHSKLVRLSSLVRQELPADTPTTDPSDDDLCLISLLQSPEFASGHKAMLGREVNESEAAAFSEVMSSIDFRCSPGVLRPRLVLVRNDEELPASTSETTSFGTLRKGQTPILWMESGLLGSSREFDFLQELGSVLPCLLRAIDVDVPLNTSLYASLLNCYRNPSKIAALCEWNNLDYQCRNTKVDSWDPGTTISLRNHEYISQSTLDSYDVGEIVAVRIVDRNDGGSRYMCAEVLQMSDTFDQGSSQLARRYKLNIGADCPKVYSYQDMYKIVKGGEHVDWAPTTSTLREQNSVTGDESSMSTFEQAERRRSLVTQLRAMENLEAVDYKKALRRLFFEWHPDKCKYPEAGQNFGVIFSHGLHYNTDRNFDFLEKYLEEGNVPDTIGCADDMSPPPDSLGRSVHTWWQEFRDEESRENNAVMREHPKAPAVRPFRGGCYISTVFAARRFDRADANAMWVQSEIESNAAILLMKENSFGCSVFHCQQSVEMAIKSLLLRTCGITYEEMNGRFCHNLVKLADRIGGPPCPDSRMELLELTNAYIRTRYLSTAGTVPATLYTQHHAESALATVRTIREWVNSCSALPTPPVATKACH